MPSEAQPLLETLAGVAAAAVVSCSTPVGPTFLSNCGEQSERCARLHGGWEGERQAGGMRAERRLMKFPSVVQHNADENNYNPLAGAPPIVPWGLGVSEVI